MTTRNNNVIKWVAIFIGLSMAAAGWVYSLGVQNERLNSNCAEDNRVHPIAERSEKLIIGIEKDVSQTQKDIGRVIKGQEAIDKKLDDLFMLQVSGPGSNP